jgi:hypothetical protein
VNELPAVLRAKTQQQDVKDTGINKFVTGVAKPRGLFDTVLKGVGGVKGIGEWFGKKDPATSISPSQYTTNAFSHGGDLDVGNGMYGFDSSAFSGSNWLPTGDAFDRMWDY